MRRTDPIPLYAQIAAMLRARLDAGVYAVGTCLPSIARLAESFGVAPETLRQAIAVLEDEGYVSRRRGVGTTVTAIPREQHWLSLARDWDGLVAFTRTLDPKFVLVEANDRMPGLTARDGQAAASYKYLKRVHYRGEEPFCAIDIHLASDVYRRNAGAFRTRMVIPVLVETPGIAIGTVRQVLRTGAADPELARLLGLPIAAPVACLRRVIRDREGRVIYLAEASYPGDVVQLEMDLSPP
ncbi:GntR family transcriptional regulator [Paralimibaculum aggregatum]|uniref:GntR family transcriptional regulator n=1 Tax=Paralimibaculum aggregatum TaxID=3036245 RepID=A0ABQ6LJS7_9RHOB|nr:GntR family transcriptional regulator [Limibaculum sp. NKW23]GMG82449.1 GntR family transcriptional regulator [Limibaculum sp. NKW23]